MTDQDVSLENRDPLVGFDGDGYKGGVNQGWLSAQWLTIKDDPKFTPHENPEDPNSPPFTPYEPCFDCVQVVENQDVICTYIPIWRSNDQSVQSIMMAIEHKETGAIANTVYMKNNLLKRNLGLDMLTLYSTYTRDDIEIIKDQHFFSQTRLFCVMDHANFGNSDIGDIIDEVERTGACPVDAKGKPLTDLSKDLECKWQIWADCKVDRSINPPRWYDCIYSAELITCGGGDPGGNGDGSTPILPSWDPDPCDHPEKEDPKDEDETDPRGGGDFNGDEGSKNNTDKDENLNNHTGNCEDEEVDCAEAQATYEALLGECGNSNFDPCANPELMVWVEEFLTNENVNYPCNPGMTNEKVVCQILGIGYSGSIIESESVLNVPSWIDNEGLLDCPFMNCLYNNILDQNSDFACDVIGSIFDDDQIGVILNNSNEQAGDSGGTYVSGENLINVDLDYFCNSSDLYFDTHASEIAGTRLILHEFQHAKWLSDAFKLGFDPGKIEAYNQMWPAYKRWFASYHIGQGASINDIHHLIMLEIEDTIKAIAVELNNIFGNDSSSYMNFMMEASSGLIQYMEALGAENSNEYQNAWLEFKAQYGDFSYIKMDMDLVSNGCIK